MVAVVKREASYRCTLPSFPFAFVIEVKRVTDYYVGLTSRPFKTRYGEHKGDFSNEDRKHNTGLATHIWDMKGGGKDPPHQLESCPQSCPLLTHHWNLQPLHK